MFEMQCPIVHMPSFTLHWYTNAKPMLHYTSFECLDTKVSHYWQCPRSVCVSHFFYEFYITILGNFIISYKMGGVIIDSSSNFKQPGRSFQSQNFISKILMNVSNLVSLFYLTLKSNLSGARIMLGSKRFPKKPQTL